jgi:stage II sporulation protein P
MTRIKRHRLTRRSVLFLIILATGWSVVYSNAAFSLTTTFSRDLSGETALALLQTEISSGTLAPLSFETLLSFCSPLLASLKAAEDAAPPEHVEPPPPQAPMITPSPPILQSPRPSAEPSPKPSEEPQDIWDDRIWPQPGENDPDARPLREVTLLPVAPDGGWLTDGTVAVNNETAFSFDIPTMLTQAPKQKAGAGPQILIIHTHGSESFLPDERDFYIPTDIERTEDTRYNIVRLGDEIAARLEKDFGLTVLHDRNINDYPTYSGSYARTLRAIEGYLKKYPGIQVVLDIHRDSITSRDGTKFKTVCESSYGKTAQMMFVVGTGGSGLPHPGWRDNMAFAAQLQSRLLDACPTLMRPIHVRRERFNQHATPGALILEIGTAANSLTEALRAANLFCDAAGPFLAELLLPG